MSLLRSEKMGYYTILMPREYAWEVLNELGELNILQFVDLNHEQAPFSKPYSNHIKRCDELENKLQVIENEMQRFKKPIDKCENIDSFLLNLKKFLVDRNKAERTFLEEVEYDIDLKLKNLLEQVKIRDTLIEKYDHLVEYRQVLLKAFPFIGGSGQGALDLSMELEGQPNEERKVNYLNNENIRFTYLAGVIDREESQRFKRILFRVTRGMVWTTLIDIERAQDDNQPLDFDHLVDTSSEKKNKTVFLIIYQGGSHDMMSNKLNKICDSFGASKYGLPSDKTGYNRKLMEVEDQLKESKGVIQITEKHIHVVLDQFSKARTVEVNYSYVEELKMFVLKEKVLYTSLNKLKYQNSLYRGNCWCPLKFVPEVYDTLARLKKRKNDIGGCEFSEISRPSDEKPPTYFQTNKVSWIFQEIVNTYGIPRYREINPGLFTIATFPFLFGVMFGDIGHGALLLLAGLYLILFKSGIENDRASIWHTLLPGRYLLAFQGFFALYCGLIYNDFMSLPFNLFGSCYSQAADGMIVKQADCTYPFGLDPIWSGSSNELTFLNSFKMKLAIVLGVTHMIFGILLRGLNNIYFRNWVDFFFEFLPMLVFMSLTFGYMMILIFCKWALPWGSQEYPTHDAPSIITVFIKMALEPGTWPEGLGIPLYGDRDGEQQGSLQSYFLIIALICAFWILIPKPLILLWKHKRATHYHGIGSLDPHERIMNKKLLPSELDHHLQAHEDEEHKEDYGDLRLLEVPKTNSSHSLSHIPDQEHFDFGEVFVHQIIEAIEFVLGSISNTASYLRLWALSLAHSQLAKVFYENALGSYIESGSIVGLVIGFMLFANVTFGVLLLMDQMECFLHALRLHWVEFQNKFYKADGHTFAPLSFKKGISQGVNK